MQFRDALKVQSRVILLFMAIIQHHRPIKGERILQSGGRSLFPKEATLESTFSATLCSPSSFLIPLDMPKASKSSASADTRKKHAKKSGDDEDDPSIIKQERPQRGQKKLSKAQKKALPKIKQYIPPPKPPAPPIPDPLDGEDLARTLPAELVVVLRRLGKKDDVTRRKGLEDLREGWVGQVLRPAGGDEDEVEKELKETALLCAVPVWVSSLSIRWRS